jgi:NarL family two-component system response regulator YdfI
VLIADDHMVVREGLRALLDAEPDLEPVGAACDGAEAVRLAGELAPDVVLMDLRMPGVDGIEAIRRIKASYPEIQVVILTTYDDDRYIVRGLRAGARGYLLKDTDRKVLYDAIRAAARGESLLPSSVVDKMVAHLVDGDRGPRRGAGRGSHRGSPPVQTETLSPREAQVLALLAEGAANKEIARALDISERTVKAHVTGIFNKLGASSRTEAVAIAMRSNLLPS